MSLQGSFETIALRDVMALLASSNKSGELRVVGGHVEGRLWIQDGSLVGSKVGKSHGHVDAVFELLRLTEGNFVFKDGVEAPVPEEPTPVEPVMREAEERLTEWEDIQRVVPSLEHRVRLIPDLPTPEVTLSAEEWRLVMAVALAATVRGVLEELGLGQFEGCRGIRRLVDAGTVIIEAPRVRPAASDPARVAHRAADNGGSPRVRRLSAPTGSVAEVTSEPETVPAALFEAPGLSPADHLRSYYDSPLYHEVAAYDPPAYQDEPDYHDQPDFAVLRHLPEHHDDEDVEAVAGLSFAVDDEEPSEPIPPRLVFPVESPAESARNSLTGRRARRQLAAVEDEVPAAAAPDRGSLVTNGAEPDPGQGVDSINRGLLLKFLSSVRS